MRCYQPSGNYQLNSIVLMFVYGLLSAGLTGLVFGLLAPFSDISIVFPILIGILPAIGTSMGSRAGHCRNTAIIIAIGFLMGLTGYAGKQYVAYRLYRDNAIAKIQAEQAGKAAHSGQPAQSATELHDAFLTMRTGRSGFWGWTSLALEKGVSIKVRGHERIRFGYAAALILALIDFLLAGISSAVLAEGSSDEPYCEKCRRWVDYERKFETTPDFIAEAEKFLRAQPDDSCPVGLLQKPPAVQPDGQLGVLTLKICPSCHDGYLSGESQTLNREKRKVTTQVFKNVAFPRNSWKAMFEEPFDKPASPKRA